MKAVLYARVSSEKQAEKDLSISAQLKALRKYATENEFGIIREFVDEAESARTANRPAFQEMISLARSKKRLFDVVLVWKLSRFARNREDSIVCKSLLRKRGIQVISINEKIDPSPAGILLEGMIEVIDEFYSTNLSQDTKRGLKENAQRGFCNGGVPPYGYKHKSVKDGTATRKVLEFDPETAPIAKKIFKLSMSGRGAKEIAMQLNDEGLITRNGKPWSKHAVLYILKNPIYTGKLVYARHRELKYGEERFTVEKAAPAMVSTKKFAHIQTLLSDRSPDSVNPRRVSSGHLLSGLLRCGKCGQAMQAVSAKSGSYHYYSCCNSLRRGKSVCDAKSVNETQLERKVIEKLKERVLTPQHLADLLELTNAELSKHQDENASHMATMQQALTKKRAKLDRLYEALESGDFDYSDLAPRIKKIKGEIDEARYKINSLQTEQAMQSPVLKITQQQLAAYVEDLYDLLSTGAVFEQRQFLKSFIKGITLDYPKVTVDYTLPLTKKPPYTTEVLSFGKKSGVDETRTRDLLRDRQAF